MSSISITFVNLFTIRRLQQTTLPALPCPGDHIYLDELGYEVAFLSWRLTAAGLQELEVMLRPFPDIRRGGSRPALFEYPQERTRWPRQDAA